jgi:hypothetical protein
VSGEEHLSLQKIQLQEAQKETSSLIFRLGACQDVRKTFTVELVQTAVISQEIRLIYMQLKGRDSLVQALNI